MANPDPRQVANSRSQLLRAVKEVWASSSYDDQLRLAVFQACLNHGLARGGETALRLLPAALTTVEGEVARAGLLRNQSLTSLLAKHTQCFRVMDKGNAGGPAVVPWLHDILTYPHPDVAALLSTMPTLSQPAPPPGIPAGIPPMRKVDATAAQVPCKHFAQGTCSKGDKCDYAHDQPRQPAHIVGRPVVRTRSGPRETPPVDKARKVLLDALSDAWPSDEYVDVFARTAARICIQQAFVLGKTVPYEQTIVHAPNMGTHLHKCGIGMVRGTLQHMLAKPEIQRYFKLTVWPKNTPPNILCLLANVFCGHPSDLVNDIVEQTHLVEPGVDKPYVLQASIAPRSSFSTRPVLDKNADSDSVSEASSSSHTSVPAEVASSSGDIVEEIYLGEPLPPAQQAQMQLVMAVAKGPACDGQGNLAVVRRAINYASLSKGFEAAQPEDATAHHGPYLYKLQSVPVTLVSEHARTAMDNYGYKGVAPDSCTGAVHKRLAKADGPLGTIQTELVVCSSSGNTGRHDKVTCSHQTAAHVRPILDNLIPTPVPLVQRILLQTKVVSSPIALPSRSTAQRKPVFALPVPAVHAEASQDSFNNVDTTSQASGDISSAVSRADETHKAGVAHSVTTDDGSVPDTSGPETSAAPQEAPQPYATAQTKLLANVEDASSALRHILQRKWVAISCEGQNVSKEGRLCLLQVYAAPVCFIFDLVGVKPATRETMISGLAQVLENEGIIKVMHDCAKPAAAIYYQLGIKLCNVFDTQVARSFLQHVAAITGGELDDFGPQIELEDLLEIYGFSLPDCRGFINPNPKHWVKRPLNHNIIEYAVAGVDPLCDLGLRMMKRVGEAGVSGVKRLTRCVIEQHFDETDKTSPSLEKRNSAVWAIGKHWRPEISQNTLSELAEEHASNSHGPAARSVEQANGHRASASGATDESASSKMHAEMPLLKAHGTRPTSAAGSSAVLQESKKQESFKSGSLINSQSNAQAKIVRATEAPAMSPSKAVTPGAGNKDQ